MPAEFEKFSFDENELEASLKPIAEKMVAENYPACVGRLMLAIFTIGRPITELFRVAMAMQHADLHPDKMYLCPACNEFKGMNENVYLYHEDLKPQTDPSGKATLADYRRLAFFGQEKSCCSTCKEAELRKFKEK